MVKYFIGKQSAVQQYQKVLKKPLKNAESYAEYVTVLSQKPSKPFQATDDKMETQLRIQFLDLHDLWRCGRKQKLFSSHLNTFLTSGGDL